MANRTVSKIFRCTPEEAQEITRMAFETWLAILILSALAISVLFFRRYKAE